MYKTKNIYIQEKDKEELKFLLQKLQQKDKSFNSLFVSGFNNLEQFTLKKGVKNLYLKFKDYFKDKNTLLLTIGELFDESEMSKTLYQDILFLEISLLKDYDDLLIAFKNVCLDKDGGNRTLRRYILPDPKKYFTEKGIENLYNTFSFYLNDEEKIFNLLYENDLLDKNKILNYKKECLNCGCNNVKYKNLIIGYNQSCSKKCSNILLAKIKQSYSDEKKLDIKKKREETCLKIYGTKCCLQNSTIKEKTNQTLQNKYGVNNIMRSSEIIQKRAQKYFEKTGYSNPNQNPEVIKKTKNTIASIENFYEKRNKKSEETRIKNSGSLEESYRINIEKTRQSFFNKTGFYNPSELQEVKEKIGKSNRGNKKTRKTKEERNLIIPLEMKKDFEIYTMQVHNLTRYNFKINKHKIKNADKRSVSMHLDHIFSIFEGFKNNILPLYIAHHTNLRIISRSENCSKNKKSGKSLNELFEDFLKETE